MFKIMYDKLLMQLTPFLLRRNRTIAWLNTLVFPIKLLFYKFDLYRYAKAYQLAHTGQVFSLENVLNDRFAPAGQPRIYITDGFTKERLYIYTRTELKPVYLKKFIHNRADYADTGVDFIVWVPKVLKLTKEDGYELNALINNYRLASKRFKVYAI